MTKEQVTEVDEDFKDDFEDEVEVETEAEAEASEKTEPKVKKPKAKAAEKVKKEKVPEGAEVFTYVGRGETPPVKTNFMGRQTFVRGRATVVTDPIVLAKIKINPCFVAGEVDMEDIHEADEKARKEADAQRAEDKRIDAAYKKKHG